MEKKILNEINDMRVKMGLNVLTENSILLTEGKGGAGTLAMKIAEKFLISDVEKNLVKKFASGNLQGTEKTQFKKFINSTSGANFIKEFEIAISNESNPIINQRAEAYLAKKIKPQLNSSTVSSIPGGASTTTPAGGASTTVSNAIAKVDAKIVNDTLYSFEKLYPNLFNKKWWQWSYVNQSRINGIKNEILRDFAGQDAKGIGKIIENKLSEAENVLKNLGIPPKQKTLVGQELGEFKDEFKRNNLKLVAKVVGTAIVVYLFYHFIMEWYRTGSPIAAVTALPFRVWGDIKSGVMSNIPYDNTQDEFLKYVIKKYGDDDYKNKYTLTPPNSDGIIKLTKKNGGGTRAFKHNGYTFREIKP